MKFIDKKTFQVFESRSNQNLRIALVKQDCYKDLYIEKINASPLDLLLSTQLRIGPLALFSTFCADFLITKYSPQEDLGFHLYQNPSPLSPEEIKLISNGRIEDIHPTLRSKSIKKHSDYSISENDVDWGRYDIVFCINVPVSMSLRLKHFNVFWVLIPSDFKFPVANIGFDAYITHRFASSPFPSRMSVQLPYTILFSNTISSLPTHKSTNAVNRSASYSIYIEVNSSNIRPPTLQSIPFLEQLLLINIPIVVHSNDITNHLESLYKAKYFVKTGGRIVNANSFAEAISASCLVLCCYEDNFGNLLLPSQCLFHKVEDLIDYIVYQEANPDIYDHLLFAQKSILDSHIHFGFHQLITLFNRKQASLQRKNNRHFAASKLKEILYKVSYFLYKFIGSLSLQPSMYLW